jgi:hypothetical protein
VPHPSRPYRDGWDVNRWSIDRLSIRDLAANLDTADKMDMWGEFNCTPAGWAEVRGEGLSNPFRKDTLR